MYMPGTSAEQPAGALDERPSTNARAFLRRLVNTDESEGGNLDQMFEDGSDGHCGASHAAEESGDYGTSARTDNTRTPILRPNAISGVVELRKELSLCNLFDPL